MSIIVPCPKCGMRLKAPDAAAGKLGKCRKCQFVLTVPVPLVAQVEKPPRRSRNRGSSWDVRSLWAILIVGLAGCGFTILCGAVNPFNGWLLSWHISQDTSVVAKIDAGVLHARYAENQQAADQTYQNRYLEVHGFVGFVQQDRNSYLMVLYVCRDDKFSYYDVCCHFPLSRSGQITFFRNGDSVVIRGRCSGMERSATSWRGILVRLNDCQVVSRQSR